MPQLALVQRGRAQQRALPLRAPRPVGGENVQLRASSSSTPTARRLQRPEQSPRSDAVAEPHEVLGRLPKQRLLERDADALPHVQQRQLGRVVRLVGQLRPFELQRGLRKPQTRRVQVAEPHEVRRRQPAGRVLERGAAALPHVQQRQLRLVDQLERHVHLLVVHGNVSLTTTATIASPSITTTAAAATATIPSAAWLRARCE